MTILDRSIDIGLQKAYFILAAHSSSWQQLAIVPVVGTLLALGSSYALMEADRDPQKRLSAPRKSPIMSVKWVKELAGEDGKELVLSAESMHMHPLLKQDHIVS